MDAICVREDAGFVFARNAHYDEDNTYITYSNMLIAQVFIDLIKQGIETGDWGSAGYYLVRMGDGYYPLPLLFSCAEERRENAIYGGKPMPTQKWVNRKRNRVLKALNA